MDVDNPIQQMAWGLHFKSEKLRGQPSLSLGRSVRGFHLLFLA
jgi:hypothetical protein